MAEKLLNAIRNHFINKKEISKQVIAELVTKVAKPTLSFGSNIWTVTEK